MFDKKFKEMLERSEEHQALVKRVASLESQVVSMSKALSDALKAYTELARITVDNRKSLEAIHDYLTDPLGETGEEPASDMTPEELAEYKRNLN